MKCKCVFSNTGYLLVFNNKYAAAKLPLSCHTAIELFSFVTELKDDLKNVKYNILKKSNFKMTFSTP